MRKTSEDDKLNLAYGSLDLLVLQTLVWGKQHGHGIAQSIECNSADTFRVDHGSLYPALQRLVQEDWIKGEWGVTENNQRAKYYRLTPSGRKKLAVETSRWERYAKAITRVLKPVDEAGE